ncbi:MAG: SRPBCC domain-containing protein [Pseudobacteriovorax sp.]|nr:SRPBCC domain-containing protein [Pseudobacteriovorax sp.]
MKKKILFTIAALLIAGLTTLWLKGKEMREISTEIEIAAPIEDVWNLVTNIDGWQEWSPIIHHSKGTASLGSKLSITMCGEIGDKTKAGPKYEPVITVFENPRNLSWRATMIAGFIFTNGKIIELETTDSGTKLVHKETFSGLMAPLLWGQVQTNVPKMLDSMNQALKALAEKS